MTPRWVERLQLSPRTERALSEAVFDRRHEVAGANGLGLKLWVYIAGSIGLLRALLMSIPREAQALRSSYWTWAIPAAITMAVVLPWAMGQDFSMFDLPNVRSFAWVSLARISAMALPTLAFLIVALAPRDEALPVLLVTASISAVAILLMAVVVPVAWENYAEVGLRRPGFMPGASTIAQIPALLLRIVFALLLANRVRVDPRRRGLLAIPVLFVLLAFATALVGVFSSNNPALARGLGPHAPAIFTMVIQLLVGAVLQAVKVVVDATPLPVLTLLFWYLLVRRQEWLSRRSTGTTPEMSS